MEEMLRCERCGRDMKTSFRCYSVEAYASEGSGRIIRLPVYICSRCESEGWRPARIVKGKVLWLSGGDSKPKEERITLRGEVMVYGWTCRLGDAELVVRDPEALELLRRLNGKKARLELFVEP